MKKIIITIFIFLCVEVGYGQCWINLATGGDHSLAIKGDGTLWAWGWNGYGQLGIGNTIDKLVPTKVGTANNWESIAAGTQFSLGLRQDGTLWAWGDNVVGQLGIGNTINKNIPTQIGNATDWAMINAAGGRCYAIKSNGTLWAWGFGTDNCLGFNDSQNKLSPTQLGTQTWRNVSTGLDHTLAINSSSNLFSWGKNTLGKLGSGNQIDNFVPTQVGIESWDNVSAGYLHSLAIKSGNTLWAWGNNASYQLGNGTVTTSLTPIQIGTATDWFEISAELNSSKGLRSPSIFTRTIWGWGSNLNGELGAGATIFDLPTPTQNGNLQSWYIFSHNPLANHSLWLGLNFVIYGSGLNNYGQIGDGTNINRNTFTPIGCGTALPITLTSFTAKNQATTNLLNWITENEINNQYFEIQHSLDGINFKPIGKLNGQLNSSNTHSYSFTHNTPSNGINYYRLKQVDVDGKFTYSNIEQVKNNIVGITIYPNPVANGLYINGIKNNTPFNIINNVGQTILKDQYCTSKPIQTAAFATGIYFLKVENTVIKFMKE